MLGPEIWTRSSSAPGLGASRARGSGSRSPRVSRWPSTLPVAGVSTLDALASARDGVYPVVDARRREVFVLGPHVSAPDRPRAGAGDDVHRERGGPVSGDARGQGGARTSERRRDPPPARALARGSRARVRAGRGAHAALCPLSGREGAELRMSVELRRLEHARSRHRRGHRAGVVPDAVVTLDVRRRAAEAERARDRRVPARPASSSATPSSPATSTPGT